MTEWSAATHIVGYCKYKNTSISWTNGPISMFNTILESSRWDLFPGTICVLLDCIGMALWGKTWWKYGYPPKEENIKLDPWHLARKYISISHANRPKVNFVLLYLTELWRKSAKMWLRLFKKNKKNSPFSENDTMWGLKMYQVTAEGSNLIRTRKSDLFPRLLFLFILPPHGTITAALWKMYFNFLNV